MCNQTDDDFDDCIAFFPQRSIFVLVIFEFYITVLHMYIFNLVKHVCQRKNSSCYRNFSFCALQFEWKPNEDTKKYFQYTYVNTYIHTHK
jgi:hypothetical protein